jgi:GcrA cell cycle regulator
MWTEQTVETLKKFALEGRSAAWIAEALGAPSRNAVIGKANRIGIKLNGGSHAGIGEGSRLAPPSPAIPWERKRAIRAERRFGTVSPSETTRRPAVLRAKSRGRAISCVNGRAGSWDFEAAEVGEMQRIGFADIGKAQCRWPIGDPLQDDFAFCGLQVARGHAYCAGHCRLAYRWP